MSEDGAVEYVELARASSERGELVLRERRSPEGPTALELRVNGVFVMDNVETASEMALASRALALVDRPEQVFVGGLGLGYTMHSVLGDSRVSACTVVEVEPALVEWMRDGTIAHGPHFLADERLSVVVADVSLALAEAGAASYDVVVLDVDNGPGYLVNDSNAALYDAPFLASARRVLRPGGALVVWSASQAPGLLASLQQVFDDAAEVPHEVDLQGRPEHYWLYLARVASGR
jgi:spermidine synthase